MPGNQNDGWRMLGGMLEHRLERVENMLRQLLRGMQIMSREMDDLIAEVAEDSNENTSILTAIDKIVAMIEAAGVDKAKLVELTNTLRANRTDLSAAIIAKTPADPNAPPAPSP